MALDEQLIDKVMRAVDAVPWGSVVSYGDVAELVGTGPRQVGKIMAHHGQGHPWWRVVAADGRLRPWESAVPHWQEEGIELASHGQGCRIRQHRADLAAWADEVERALDNGEPISCR